VVTVDGIPQNDPNQLRGEPQGDGRTISMDPFEARGFALDYGKQELRKVS
jgi:hypothetical protein